MKTPVIYFLSHIILGFLSYKYRWVSVFFFIYQLAQYNLNIRFFFLNKECLQNKICYQSNNSFTYTLYKLTQFFIGYIIARIYYYYQK